MPLPVCFQPHSGTVRGAVSPSTVEGQVLGRVLVVAQTGLAVLSYNQEHMGGFTPFTGM